MCLKNLTEKNQDKGNARKSESQLKLYLRDYLTMGTVVSAYGYWISLFSK